MLIQEKVNQAKNILKEFDIDCWITFVRESQINGDPSLAFLVSSDITWHSAFIISKNGATHAIVGEYDRMTVEDTGAYDQVTGFVEGVKKPLQEYLTKINPKQIAINYSKGSEVCDGLTYGMYLTLFEFLQEIGLQDRLISAEKIVSALRQRKTETEVNYMKKAIEITETIFDTVTDFISPGKTEREIADFMKAEVYKRNLEFAWDESVCPAVFTGPEGAGAHYAPTDKTVEKGHILNMDFGVKFNGYCSDMQRTFYIMKDDEDTVPEDVQLGFDTIVHSIESAKRAISPGKQGHEIDKVARDAVTSAGFKEFPHGLGHQVGRYSHDGTALLGPAWEKYANKPFEILEEGMVFTIEPRLTVKDRGIATIEEMVVITKDGADWLSHPQKKIIVIR
jgi:Xaa-Pro aminopeptidase